MDSGAKLASGAMMGCMAYHVRRAPLVAFARYAFGLSIVAFVFALPTHPDDVSSTGRLAAPLP